MAVLTKDSKKLITDAEGGGVRRRVSTSEKIYENTWLAELAPDHSVSEATPAETGALKSYTGGEGEIFSGFSNQTLDTPKDPNLSLSARQGRTGANDIDTSSTVETSGGWFKHPVIGASSVAAENKPIYVLNNNDISLTPASGKKSVIHGYVQEWIGDSDDATLCRIWLHSKQALQNQAIGGGAIRERFLGSVPLDTLASDTEIRKAIKGLQHGKMTSLYARIKVVPAGGTSVVFNFEIATVEASTAGLTVPVGGAIGDRIDIADLTAITEGPNFHEATDMTLTTKTLTGTFTAGEVEFYMEYEPLQGN